MSEENQAALVDPLDAFVQGQEEIVNSETITESATVEEAQELPVEKNGVQERINKITADKHKEIRQREAEAKRADDLQARLDVLENKKPTLTEPQLEDFDYDEETFNKAKVSYQVQEEVKLELESQRKRAEQSQQQADSQKSLDVFNEKVTALGVDDWDVKVSTIPDLPPGVANAIMDLDNGAEMIQHLFTNLDKADALATMSPMAAMMELGRISTAMSVKPEIKLSAAPDPIDPVSAGSALNSEVGDEMPIAEWMAKFG